MSLRNAVGAKWEHGATATGGPPVGRTFVEAEGKVAAARWQPGRQATQQLLHKDVEPRGIAVGVEEPLQARREGQQRARGGGRWRRGQGGKFCIQLLSSSGNGGALAQQAAHLALWGGGRGTRTGWA